MRKTVIFCVVLLIQISIIYGLYRWYVSGTTTTNNIPKDQPVASEAKVEKNVTEQQKIKSNSELPAATATSNSASKPANIDNLTPRTVSNDTVSKPLIFKYADWGNISSLPQSNLAATGILVNIDTRNVLWAKHCRKSVPIASMTKMMTALLTFETVKNDPNITMDTLIKVTPEAYKIGGSQVWLDPRESFKLKDLLRTVMIKSANDSAYLIAQYLGHGDVNNFVKLMNKRAKEINMPNAHFSNPDGLPEKYSSEDNRATAEGLVFLAEHLLQYPQAIKWATTKIDWFRKDAKQPTMLSNTNHLVRDGFEGITGMKTGYINRSGYCLTATCERNGKRLVAVVTGFKSRKVRDQFVKKLLNWGYERDAEISTKK